VIADDRAVCRGVLANSIPKAGTYLLKKGLSLLPGLTATDVHLDIALETDYMAKRLREAPAGGIVTGHLVHRADYAEMVSEQGYRLLLMVRDPRDVVVSFAHYVTKSPDHYLHRRYNAIGSDERLMTTIVGIPEPLVPWRPEGLLDIGKLYGVFAPWRKEPVNREVRFEDLIGLAGGGSRERQERAIRGVAGHLGLPLTAEQMRGVADHVFDVGSPTFRKASIGAWKEHFTSDHVRAFKEIAGQTLVEWGYEKDLDW
jgi:hypothetical protein